jgi:hypothetical protein
LSIVQFMSCPLDCFHAATSSFTHSVPPRPPHILSSSHPAVTEMPPLATQSRSTDRILPFTAGDGMELNLIQAGPGAKEGAVGEGQ